MSELSTTVPKSVKWSIGILTCSAVFLLVLAIVAPGLLQKKINEEAANGLIMTPDNYEMWVTNLLQEKGQTPGKSGAVIERKFTFFDFVNPLDVMFGNQKPKFVEVGPFIYQQFQNMSNPKFNEDGTVVEFDNWVHFQKVGDFDDNTQINIANYVAIGGWYQITKAELPLMSLKIIGQFIQGFDKTILQIAIVNAYIAAFLPKYTYEAVRLKLLGDLPEEQAQRIWNDRIYGMKDQSGLMAWYNGAMNGLTSESSDLLRDYFQLSLYQLNKILTPLNESFKSTQKLVDLIFCSEAPNGVCTSRFLTAKQWAQQGVTKSPIKGFPGQDSVVIGNDTAWGYPELGYFQTGNKEYLKIVYFKEHIDNAPVYQQYIPIETAMKLLNYTDKYEFEKKNYLSDPWLLLNIGNMRDLINNGSLYNEDPSQNEHYLEAVGNNFNITKYQARVLYEYVKYMGTEFACQLSRGGNTGIGSLGGVIATTLYQKFVGIQNQLLSTILVKLLAKRFTQCGQVLEKIDDITQVQIDDFCSHPLFEQWNEQAISNVLAICDEPETELWGSIYDETDLRNTQLLQMCDFSQEGFGKELGLIHAKLKQLYSCQSDQCSQRELALKQWGYSQITLNPPEEGLWEPSVTLKDVFPSLSPIPLEYNWFIQEFEDVMPPKQNLSFQDLDYLMTYECLFAVSRIMDAFLFEINNDKQNFTKIFLFEEFEQLNHYLRYFMVESYLGGLSQKRTVKELLFGYEDPLLKGLAIDDPALAGDPSIPYVIGFNKNNTIDQAPKQSMYTGKDDTKKVRHYYQVENSSVIRASTPYFNGKEITKKYIKPWEVDINVERGTDGFCAHPGLNLNEQPEIVLLDLYRSAKLKYNETKVYHGLETYKYVFDEDLYNINSTYHNEKYFGLVNLTEANGVPVFNSFRHFYEADPVLVDAVEIYDDYQLQNQQKPNQWDESYFQIEPISGAILSAFISLQINTEYQPNFLFPSKNNSAMLPFLAIQSGANFTTSQVDEYFGPLKTALKAKSWIRWGGIALGLVLLLIAGIIYIFKVRRYTNNKAKTQLLLQNNSEHIDL